MFEYKVVGNIFVGKRNKIAGEWRKLHTAELHTLYSSPNITRDVKSRQLRWAGHVARMEQYRNVYRVLVGKPERRFQGGPPLRICLVFRSKVRAPPTGGDLSEFLKCLGEHRLEQ